MAQSFLSSLLGKGKNEPFVSIDIGTSSIKLMELDVVSNPPKMKNAGMGPTPGNAINNNAITKPELVGAAIRSIIEANGMKAKRAVVAVPGPATFTKKIVIAQAKLQELRDNIVFEASNYIPHKIDAVHFDFQVLKQVGPLSMEVLLVAVKNEIIGSYIDAVERAGLEPAIVDVDYFALENMFELNRPSEINKTVALVNIGARYSGVNIVQDGQSLFTGDVGVGGRLYTDALCETLNLGAKAAEEAKMGQFPEGCDEQLVTETMERTTEHITSELHRQLGFFWNAAATSRTIDAVYLSGGGAQTKGLLEELSAKTGIECRMINPFSGLDTDVGFDRDYLAEIAPHMAVSVGLAMRRFGDKKHAVA